MRAHFLFISTIDLRLCFFFIKIDLVQFTVFLTMAAGKEIFSRYGERGTFKKASLNRKNQHHSRLLSFSSSADSKSSWLILIVSLFAIVNCYCLVMSLIGLPTPSTTATIVTSTSSKPSSNCIYNQTANSVNCNYGNN